MSLFLLINRFTWTQLTILHWVKVRAPRHYQNILWIPFYQSSQHWTLLVSLLEGRCLQITYQSKESVTFLLCLWKMATELSIPKTYLINQIVPFSANLVGQVLSCPASFSSQNSGPTHIRWILNDAVVPLTGISGCVEDKNGLCELDIFTSGMKQRIEEIDFNFDCFANYSIPIPDNVVDGRFPKNL